VSPIDNKEHDLKVLLSHEPEEINSADEERREEEKVKIRRLNWVDLLLALMGIAVLYLGIGYVLAWLAQDWENEKVLLYINGFLTQGVFLLIILGIMRMRKWTWRDFGWKGVKERYIGNVITLYILTWIINTCYAAYLLNKGFTLPETDAYSKLLGDVTVITFCLNLFLAGILAPVIEETLFRGIIFGSLRTYMGKWTAAGVSAAFFSALHLQSYGFVPRFVLGLVLAYLFMKYQSLKPAVALHAVNNIVALVLVVLLDGL